MPLLPICQSIERTASSTFLRESTWGFPIMAALHFLCIAWFGGAVLFGRGELREWKRCGLAAVLLTGAALFWIEPVKCYSSIAFHVKLALLALLTINAFVRTRMAPAINVALLAGIVFAARWIAYL